MAVGTHGKVRRKTFFQAAMISKNPRGDAKEGVVLPSGERKTKSLLFSAARNDLHSRSWDVFVDLRTTSEYTRNLWHRPFQLAAYFLPKFLTRCLEENDEKHERERKIKMKKANRGATFKRVRRSPDRPVHRTHLRASGVTHV